MAAAADLRVIRQVLREKLLTVPGVPPTDRFKAENRRFDPPNPPDLWMRETLMVSSEFLVANKCIEIVGRMQYDIFVPAGSGTEAAETLAKEIKDTFQPAQSINSQGVSLEVDQVSSSGAIQDPVWYMIPVSIRWRTYAFKTTLT